MKVVSFIAGIEGIDSAFESQAHKVIWANEFDSVAVADSILQWGGAGRFYSAKNL